MKPFQEDMQRERVTDAIYVFTSDLYVQVTATLILTTQGAILWDTLLYPEETLQIRHFVETRLNSQVRYIINSHYHADHVTGTCLFPSALVIAHRRCRDLLDTRGRESLARAKAKGPEFSDVDIILPHMVFEDRLTLHIGGKTLHLRHSPGHSPDSIVCYLEEDQILFAADTMMPVPHFVNGNCDSFVESLEVLRDQAYEVIVQGHGEVILRGEVESKIKENITYLRKLQAAVDKAISSSSTPARLEKALEAIKLETCGKSRVLLNGAVQQLHHQNVLALAHQRRHLQPQTD